MPKLTDTQLVILSVAAQRQNRAVLPLPKAFKIKSAAVVKTLEGLCKKSLLEEMPATRNAVVWREGEDGRRLMLIITESGLQAIAATPKRIKPQTTARQGTKQALLINLLKRKKGATIEAIVGRLDWQSHTVRAALTRLRQQGLAIERVREGGVSRYCIAEDRKAA